MVNMKNVFKKIIEYLTLFIIYGIIYITIEIAFRNHSDISMFYVGGLAGICIGLINELLSWKTPFCLQCLIGGIIVTIIELIAGIILNIWLGLNIWDYSNMAMQLWGQICLPFSIAWCGLSAIVIVVDDWLRYWLFKEEKPHYKFI